MNLPDSLASKPASKFRLLWWLLWIGWFIAIFILSSIPGNRLYPLPFAEADKVAHSSLFALGAIPLFLALQFTLQWKPARTTFLTLGLMAVFGAIDEIHQLWTPGRSGADVGDWLADLLGAAIGLSVILFFYGPRLGRAHPRSPAPDRAS